MREDNRFDIRIQVGHMTSLDSAIRSRKLIGQPIHIRVCGTPNGDRDITRGASGNTFPGGRGSGISAVIAKDTRVGFNFKKASREATGSTVKEQGTSTGEKTSMTGLTVAAGVIERRLSEMQGGLAVGGDGENGRRDMVGEDMVLRDKFRTGNGVSRANSTRVDRHGQATHRVINAGTTAVGSGATISVVDRLIRRETERLSTGIKQRDIRDSSRQGDNMSSSRKVGTKATQAKRARHHGQC